MKIVYMGSKQAGMVGLLTVRADGHEILAAVCYDDALAVICRRIGIKVFDDINSWKVEVFLRYADLIVSVHGRQIVRWETLEETYYGGINLHPCLSEYKGARPIDRMLADGKTRASVGAHWMTEEVDLGGTIVENFIEVNGRTPVEVYNELYPLYSLTLLQALLKVRGIDGD